MPSYAGVDQPNLLRSGARAGSIIVWIGGPVTAGGGATSAPNRMSSIASRDLGLTEKNYSNTSCTISNANVANNIVSMGYKARDDTSYDHNQVAYVVICGGLQDDITRLADIMLMTKYSINDMRAAFPRAQIVVAAGPGCITGTTSEARDNQATVINSITAQARRQSALALNLRSVCGTDATLQSSGILPNNEGHALLAEAIVDAIVEDQGEPVDTPITPTRTYSSGLDDWASRQVEATRRREAEKREANRPTGTELGGVTQKLDELTQQQGVQQILLEQQQEQLKKQQEELERHQQELENQQKQLKAAQDQLASQQTQLKAAQDQLAQQQAAIKAAQDQLKQQQTQLGNQQGQLDSAQQQFEATIRNYVNNELVPKLNTEFNKVNARLDALEKGTPV